jgi:hypothetical protein
VAIAIQLTVPGYLRVAGRLGAVPVGLHGCHRVVGLGLLLGYLVKRSVSQAFAAIAKSLRVPLDMDGHAGGHHRVSQHTVRASRKAIPFRLYLLPLRPSSVPFTCWTNDPIEKRRVASDATLLARHGRPGGIQGP